MLAYAIVVFLSAFLIFLVQPLLGKTVLPWFGGASAVWTTCLMFFQGALLAGYAAAHGTTRLGHRRQAFLYLVVLVLTVALMPLAVSDAWKPVGTESPIARIAGLLTVTIGAPFLLMSSTTPLVQRWATPRARAKRPYALYAVSNAGSLLGLLLYPFLIERVLALGAQMALWSALYVVFVVLAGWLALTHARGGVGVETGSGPSPSIALAPARREWLWFGLAISGSGLLVATTNEICLNIAAVPLLWVVPLALYLVTLMLAFGGAYSRRWATTLFVAVLVFIAFLNLIYATALWQIAGACLVLFAGAWACHGELARLAPDPRHLTAYYLAISAGGAAGGAFGALVAPLVFREFWEFPLFLLLAYGLFLAAACPGATPRGGTLRWIARAIPAGLVVASFSWPVLARSGETVATARNFFGILRVYDGRAADEPAMRRFQHGRIVHGAQFLDPSRRREPTAYYRWPSGIAVAIQRHPNRASGSSLRIGVIGLGVGTLAAWGADGDRIRFYEINPDVIDMARRYFTFLTDTPAAVDVVTGDGRLALEREANAGQIGDFDLLVADAFSADAIPVHLLTREAAALYWRRLRDDGVLVFNVTNRYLDVAPVVRGLAREFGKDVVEVITP
ncbi:MAG: fused MFS/spermidine synthase, partial [Acidobacteria bacterium]|nr:fused MFS/spermidine synthase [Acidobacteriota bacterium]